MENVWNSDYRNSFQAKMEAIFLNQVKNFKWYYFNLNLGQKVLDWESIMQTSSITSLIEEKIQWNSREEVYEYLAEPEEVAKMVAKKLATGTRTLSPVRVRSWESDDIILANVIAYTKLHPRLPRKIINRIFDTNDPAILNRSEADEGKLGSANERTFQLRLKKFQERIWDAEFQRNRFAGSDPASSKKNFVILAEGDSWFQFPNIKFIGDPLMDTIDWMYELTKEEKSHAIYNLAYGGDWLSNIMKSGHYIEELSKINVDMFMLSGGGNDMLGGKRLATMVLSPQDPRRQINLNTIHADSDSQEKNPILEELLDLREKQPIFKDNPAKFDMYKTGLGYMADEFFEFISLTMSQYFLLFSELFNSRKFDNVIFTTQGYDAPIPSRTPRGPWSKENGKSNWWKKIVNGAAQPRRRLINNFLDTGRWLYDPLMMKGIYEERVQQAILFVMIHEFNEMLIQLANYQGFPRLFHVDCRGIAPEFSDWYDEIHLNKQNFKYVAQTFLQILEDRRNGNLLDEKGQAIGDKVYRVLDLKKRE
ncbi:MAG: hypothetical protein MRZ79_17090 [Bacteroidia bacterium]|nr:hypothetical protein [Bacteroidia bacterium]